MGTRSSINARRRGSIVMATQNIRKRVAEIVAHEFELEADDVVDDAHLYDDLGLDSLDAIDLVVALEKNFGFKVEEGAAKTIRTVRQLNEFVEQQAAEKA